MILNYTNGGYVDSDAYTGAMKYASERLTAYRAQLGYGAYVDTGPTPDGNGGSTPLPVAIRDELQAAYRRFYDQYNTTAADGSGMTINQESALSAIVSSGDLTKTADGSFQLSPWAAVDAAAGNLGTTNPASLWAQLPTNITIRNPDAGTFDAWNNAVSQSQGVPPIFTAPTPSTIVTNIGKTPESTIAANNGATVPSGIAPPGTAASLLAPSAPRLSASSTGPGAGSPATNPPIGGNVSPAVVIGLLFGGLVLVVMGER